VEHDGRRAVENVATPPVVLAVAVVLTHISNPLLAGEALRVVTVLSVLLFTATTLTHATLTFGARTAVTLLVLAGGLGLTAETVGVRTGYPFGSYTYADTLGPKLFGVPVVVPLAWTMMAYPCLLAGRRLGSALTAGPAGRRALTALLGGGTLAAWDLFLDPRMVDVGHWTWRFPHPALPGVPGVPLTNYAGWLLVAVLIVAALDARLSRQLGSRPDAAAEAVPAALLGWTWLSSALASLVFYGRPAAAGYGFVAMGLLVLPYLAMLTRAARSTRRPIREPARTGG
jgi:putative membrane protein